MHLVMASNTIARKHSCDRRKRTANETHAQELYSSWLGNCSKHRTGRLDQKLKKFFEKMEEEEVQVKRFKASGDVGSQGDHLTAARDPFFSAGKPGAAEDLLLSFDRARPDTSADSLTAESWDLWMRSQGDLGFM